MPAKKKWYDVHFTVSGYQKIHATSKAHAAEIAEEVLVRATPALESVLKTGIEAEVTDVVPESSYLFDLPKRAEITA